MATNWADGVGESRHQPTLLLLDDEDHVLAQAGSNFEMRGYHVVKAKAHADFESKEDLVGLMRRAQPDAILTDFSMGKTSAGVAINGLLVAEAAKEAMPHVLRIMHTGNTDDVSAAAGKPYKGLVEDGTFAEIFNKDSASRIHKLIQEHLSPSQPQR